VRRPWPRTSRRFLAASVGLALLAALLMRSYLAHAAASTGLTGPSVQVVVAAQSIGRGHTLTPADLKTARFPQAYAPPGSISRIVEAAGRVALSDLSIGEAVTQTRLARVRAGPVSSLTPEGLRAFAVPTSLPPGSVAAGDHVDILATYSGGQPHTETVVDGVEVLLVLGVSGSGAGSSQKGLGLDTSAAGIGGSSTLLVLVAPEQEERLAYARAFADLEVTIAPADPSAA